MSELEQLQKMLEGRATIKKCSQDCVNNYIAQYNAFSGKTDITEAQAFEVGNGVIGNPNFVSIWLFDMQGNLLTVGHYE